MNKHTTILLILIALTVSSLSQASFSSRLKKCQQAKSVITAGLSTIGAGTLVGTAFVGYHEAGWRNAHKQIIELDNRHKQLEKEEEEHNFGLLRELETGMAAPHVYWHHGEKKALPWIRYNLSKQRSNHYQFALFSKFRYRNLNKAIIALDTHK